jgi:glycerol-3-phosphate dehydrogenase
MVQPYDVLILGAGVVGSAIARQLTRHRLRVALVEKEAEVGECRGASREEPPAADGPASLPYRLWHPSHLVGPFDCRS